MLNNQTINGVIMRKVQQAFVVLLLSAIVFQVQEVKAGTEICYAQGSKTLIEWKNIWYGTVRNSSTFKTQNGEQALKKMTCIRPSKTNGKGFIACYLPNEMKSDKDSVFRVIYFSCKDKNNQQLDWQNYGSDGDVKYVCGSEHYDECRYNQNVTI
jgi:hypothetical protein